MATILPYILAFIAVTCYASLTPLAKKLVTGEIPPLALIATSMIFLSVYAIIASLFFEKDFSFSKIETTTWLGIAAFSFINFVGFALYLMAIKDIPVTQYQIIFLISPIITGFIAYLILSEEFKMQYIYSLPFIGIGLYIALKS